MTDAASSNAGSHTTADQASGDRTLSGDTVRSNVRTSGGLSETPPVVAEVCARYLHSGRRWLVVYLVGYALFGAITISFFPSYGWPDGDEATYCSYAMRPWTLTSDFFEGFRPKEVINPYNFRLFLAPFSVLFQLVGFTYVGARWIVFCYGLVMLALVYGLARRLVPPAIALAAVIAMSLSPMFVLHTHMVRPEGMMAMWLTGVIWFAVRRDTPLAPKTCFVVGLLAAASLWIHYNGVVIFPLMLVALAASDRSFRRSANWGAYLASGVVFSLLYAAINFWPARETIAEFGLMPVTFASSNRVPLLEPAYLLSSLNRSVSYYVAVLWNGTDGVGWLSARLTLVLLLPTMWTAVAQPGDRLIRLLSAILGLLGVAYLLVFPNARWEYLFYAFPLMWLLAIRGLSQLPASRDMVVLTSTVFVGLAGCYAFDTGSQLRAYWAVREDNQRVGVALQSAVQRFGKPHQVVVMGAQEFHCFVPEVRYRTFHSLITLRDFGEVLRRFSPHVVILNNRGLRAIATFLNDRLIVNGYVNLPPEIGNRWIAEGILRRDPATGRWSLDTARVEPYVRATLIQQGYRRLGDVGRLRWNGSRVDIYVRGNRDAARPQDATQAGSESAAKRCHGGLSYRFTSGVSGTTRA